MNEDLGIATQRIAEREKYAPYQYKAPVVAGKSHRITVNCKTGERTVEQLEEQPPKPTPAPKRAEVLPSDPLNRKIRAVMVKFCEAFSEATGKPYTMDMLRDIRRHRDISWPRQVCMRLVHDIYGDLSTNQIGRAFDRDHTTVMHALKKGPAHLIKNRVWLAAYDQVYLFYASQPK